jgi:hypothetical protein
MGCYSFCRIWKATTRIKCKHLEEVTAIRHTLQSRVDLFVDEETREIVFMAIFLDAREFFSHQTNNTSPIPEPQLKYMAALLSLGRIPSNILGVPLEQFGETTPHLSTVTQDSGGSLSRSDLFQPAEYIVAKTTDIPNDISTIMEPLLDKHPSVTAEQIMSFGALKYEDLCAGQRSACLNQSLLGKCNNQKCSYIHDPTRPTAQQAKEVAAKLAPVAWRAS